METNKVHKWLTLAANIAVLGGLILLAYQINQNIEITKAQLTNDYYLADMQFELAMMGDEPVKSWIKAVYTPDQISREDAAIIDRYFNFGLVQLNRLRRMHQVGLVDDDWVGGIDYLRWHLGNEVGRRWWSHFKAVYPEDFVHMVDKALADSDYRGNRRQFDSMLPQWESDKE